nr:U11/U12 small nuclear ribonucleoprotein 25 kDa protein-like isoform X2 [Ipomoea batatas]
MQAYDESCNSTPMIRFQRNGSLSCPVEFLRRDGHLRRSFSYSKISQRPLKLTVLKLDGSSFEIEVPRNGQVAELKKAVEAAFSHLPYKALGAMTQLVRPHVWGHFCLSHDYEKLLSESDPIGLYGIRDGDQLEFVRHVSISYLGKRTEREDDPDPDLYEPCFSSGFQDKHAKWLEHDNHYLGKLEYHRVDIYDDVEDEEKDSLNGSPRSNRKHKLLHILRKWFTHHRKLQRKGSMSRIFVDNSRNIRLLSQYRNGSRKIVEYNFDTRSCNVSIR